MGSGELYGPTGYSSVWWVVGIVALALVVVWPFFGWWLTRPRPVPPLPPPPPPDPEQPRREALHGIDAVLAEHRAGAIGAREAHVRLSLIVRRFAATRLGTDVDSMTLRELTDHLGSAGAEPAALVDLVRRIYPPVFARDEHRAVDQTAIEATEVVRRWR